jgi:hypothetical protein
MDVLADLLLLNAIADNPQAFLILIGIIVVILCIWLIVKAIQKSRKTASPDNIKRIKDTQSALLENRWTGITQSKKSLQTAFASVPTDQQLLINTAVQSVRLGGYLGPYMDGVFDEDTATRLALASGARCLVLEIDRDPDTPTKPALLYRDSWGMKRSLNTGNLKKVASSLAGRAFKSDSDGTPPGVANDPLLVVLYFVNAPDPAKTPKDYIRFLAATADALYPLRSLLVGQTPSGDFRRQQQESQLFFYPASTFNNRILMLTNADTSAFRQLKALGLDYEIKAEQDLDLMIHARLYSRESPSGLGISAPPTSSQSASAVITTDQYWLSMPPDRLADAQSQTKKAWTLVLSPTASEDSNTNLKTNLNTILTTYGVHAVPFVLFDPPAITDGFVGPSAPFQSSAWVAKPDLIRFVPPKPIVTQKPIPQTNSGGGALVAPS